MLKYETFSTNLSSTQILSNKFYWIMHQSERVSSTSGNDKNDTNDSNDNNIDDDSDIDSWPEDSISPNDSK